PSVEAVEGGYPARPQNFGALGELDCAGTRPGRGKIPRRLFAEDPGGARGGEGQRRGGGGPRGAGGGRGAAGGPRGARGRGAAAGGGRWGAGAGAGGVVLGDAWRRHAGEEVFLDIPDGNAAAALARSAGLAPQRPLTRMCRGVKIRDRPDELWASSGPEKG